MANFVNYQHVETLLNAYEKAYPEKNKNACQNAAAEILYQQYDTVVYCFFWFHFVVLLKRQICSVFNSTVTS